MTTKMPALFVGHGSPMNTLEHNRYTEAWQSLGRSIPRPHAILAVSAHWTTHGTAVTAMAQPSTIHDFGGFPDELFAVQYPARGDPALAQRVRDLLNPTAVGLDQDWGLDHGTWSVLAHMYPQADVPVVQLSLDIRQKPAYHFELAARLNALRDEGILIFGSGNVVHNLMRIQWSAGASPYDWAERFHERIRTSVESEQLDPVIDYASGGPDAHLSVPTPEHYLPLLYVLAQKLPGDPVSFPVEGIEMGSIDMMAVGIGLPGGPALVRAT